MSALRICLALAIAVLMHPAAARAAATTSRSAATQTASDDRIVIFKPGVAINWTQRQVELTGKIALRQGALELFACATDRYGGDKTHESIVLLDARPLHVFQALGLIGLQPGRPARWDAKKNAIHPATGQTLELGVEWLDDGRRRRVDASEWMRRIDDPKAPLGPLPWVLAGSAPSQDDGILADEDGTVATLVDFDGSIIGLSVHHPRDYDQMWIEARTEKVPQLDMPVTVLVRAAGLRLEMDRFGRVFLNGRRHDPETITNAVKDYLKASPNGRISVLVAPTTLDVDIRRLKNQLRAAGVPEASVEVHRRPASDFPANDPKAGGAFLRDQLPLQRSLLESAGREHKRLVDQLTSRQSGLERRASELADYVARLRSGLNRLASESDTDSASAGDVSATSPPAQSSSTRPDLPATRP
ncbi:MAG: hypothetical protein JXQ73_26750 [Phycisphaerae bacterium]|nr:hypothetical protein [Phycisphaerae bacterium]